MSVATDSAATAAAALHDSIEKVVTRLHDQEADIAAKNARIADLEAQVASHLTDDAATQAVADKLQADNDALATAVNPPAAPTS